MTKELTQFVIGCNYWASNAGTEMWRQYDAEAIRKDFQALAENGSDTLRIFPNWRDFQPITTIDGFHNRPGVYRMDNGTADGAPLPNIYGLDPVMLDRFAEVCDIAEECGISLIVSIITGWMSGRMFVPPVLKGRDVITDPEALKLQHWFAEGLVKYVKGKKAIIAWDLGNECNCMGDCATNSQAYMWTFTIASSIRNADPSRPVLSGMHSLDVESDAVWRLTDQGELTDILTPHPYPGSPTIGANVTPEDSYRSMLLPTAQMALYAAIGGKPAMIEEQGTLNRIYNHDENAALVASANMVSCWANEGKGYLWWCAFDQKNLNFAPYSLSMRELGWMKMDRTPKPITTAAKAFSEKLDRIGQKSDLQLHRDAVIVMTIGSSWQNAETAYMLAKQAGITATYAWHGCTSNSVAANGYGSAIPHAPIYMLPSISGWTSIYKETYYELLRRVSEEGAILYVSWKGGVLEQFEEIFKLRSAGQHMTVKGVESAFAFSGGTETIAYKANGLSLNCTSIGAEVLAEDEDGNAIFSTVNYGKGKLFFLNFGLEDMLWNDPYAFEGGCRFVGLYRTLLDAAYPTASTAASASTTASASTCASTASTTPTGSAAAANASTGSNVSSKMIPIRSANPLIGVTRHTHAGREYAVAINYSSKSQPMQLTIAPGIKAIPLLNQTAAKSALDGTLSAKSVLDGILSAKSVLDGILAPCDFEVFELISDLA